ncbi:hypothetical protein AALC25_15465 [Lachnospiraceae bacterium 29-84]
MGNGVKVGIAGRDGLTKEMSGDTAICFTISKAEGVWGAEDKPADVSVDFVGDSIPYPLLPDVIAGLIRTLVKRVNGGNQVEEAFILHDISWLLEARSKELMGRLTGNEGIQAFLEIMERIQRDINSIKADGGEGHP